MPWLSVTLTATSDAAELLSDALLENGALAATVSDAYAGTPQEQPLFDEPGETAAPWRLLNITALFNHDDDVPAAVAAALRATELDPQQKFETELVADQDWVRVTQSQFQPVRISERLWVVPSWHEPPQPQAINLVIDPGMAFGTGTHPTTRQCLGWLDMHIRGGERVLDYGCGSGILAIAAMKLGAAAATGIDIDEAAILAARQNAMQNRAEVHFENAAAAAPVGYDIVLANILANPLKLLAPLLAQAAAEGGCIVLSGILESQAGEIVAVYRDWFDISALRSDDGWTLLTGVKKSGVRP